jgi:hypothetical protein
MALLLQRTLPFISPARHRAGAGDRGRDEKVRHVRCPKRLDWYFAGEGGRQSSCWSDSDLDRLKSVPGTAFEVVETGRILRKS